MKMLFVHDHPFYVDGDVIYSGGGLPAKVWKNYLPFFQKLIIMGRKSCHEKDKKVKSSGDINVSFNLISNYKSFKGIIKNYKSTRQEIKIQVSNADVIFSRQPSILSLLAAQEAIRQKKTLVVEQVGNARESLNNHSKLGKILSPFIHGWNKRIVKKADFVIYVTQKALQKQIPFNKESIDISNVILPYLLEKKEIKSARFDNEVMKIGLIGGFDMRYKGQLVLLKAIYLLPQLLKNQIEIEFVGKGDFTWIKEEAAKLNLLSKITFIGPKSAGEEVLEWTRSLGLYIQPSFTEGMPRALLEAMSMGCPVLGSDVGGIPDLIADEQIHKPGDEIKLSRQIEKLVLNRDLLHSLSLKSLELAAPFHIDILNNKRLYYYSKIVDFAKAKK